VKPAMFSIALISGPPSAQGSFACARCYLVPGRPLGSSRRALPLLQSSYEPMRQTKSLPVPRVAPCAPGPCRLRSAPAGRWPFPTLSLQPLRRRSDPYHAALPGCERPLLRQGHRSHPTGNGFDARIYPHMAASVGSRLSRLQSFVYLRAPTLARPPGCSNCGVFRHRAAGPFTPRIARVVTQPGMWRRFMSDTDN
jgi:hypothetical protein